MAEPATADGWDPAGAVVVVTGATRGIGRQIALRLGHLGAAIVAVGRTGTDDPDAVLPGSLPELARVMDAEGITVHTVRANLTDPDDTARIVDETLGRFGRCDVLVNNAAFTSNGPIMAVPWSRWEKAFRVQVSAPLQLCQGLVPGMLERGEGRVVNVSSSAATALTPDLGLYSTSKQAMERWNASMHLEVGGRGVSFNVLRVDRVVTTEGWQHVYDTQGEEIATGGGGLAATMTPEAAAAHAEWVIRQPTGWSGHVVGFDDIAALGGPPCPPLPPPG